MPTRFLASGRPSSPAISLGRASGSVLAFLIFLEIVSASSVRLMRERSEGSDFDIFFDPSRRLMMRAAGPPITGSVIGKKPSTVSSPTFISTPTPSSAMRPEKSLLNFWAMSRVNSRCCFWSSPTGTWVAR